MSYLWLSLDTVEGFVPLARRLGVSEVARSEGFVPEYRKAGGDPNHMSDYWANRRDGFIKRHMAQVKLRGDPLWDKDGNPTRRHLALVMWAYSPHATRLSTWMKRHGI